MEEYIMAGPFISEDMFAIVVKYREVENKSSGRKSNVVINDKETELRYKDLIKEIHTQWCQLNWKQSNDLIRASTKWDHDAGQRVIDWPLYRATLLDKCMKSWDIDGVACDQENIAKLDPNIASALVDEFLTRTTPTEQDLGN